MEPLKLEDIIPTAGSFTLKTTGKKYTLRPFNMNDEIWLKHTFGNDEEITKLLQGDLFKVVQIAYHQIIEEDKKDFKFQEVEFTDDNGKSEKIEIGGYKLLFSMVSGWSDKKSILDALLMTIGISRPVLEKAEQMEKEKKNLLNKQIGQESLISSIQSTAGEKKIS